MSNLRNPFLQRDDPKAWEQFDRVITEMRRRRIGYRAIGEAFDVFTGHRLTEGQVRHRCQKLGLPVNEAMRR